MKIARIDTKMFVAEISITNCQNELQFQQTEDCCLPDNKNDLMVSAMTW